MNIQFDNDRLRHQISNERELRKKYGSNVAKQIQNRMLHLDASENLEELCTLPGNWKPLKYGRKNQYSARLSKKLRLIIKPDEQARKQDGSIDPKQVKNITVMEITDYHREE